MNAKPLVGAIIQCRLTSSRLPRKHLLQLNGKPLLEHLVNRAHAATLVEKVILAAPHNPECCLNEEIFIGSEDDVLDRYYQASKKFNLDIIVRLTADCPLVPPSEIDRVVERILVGDTDYVTNIGKNDRFGTPDGWDVEAFTFDALEEAWRFAGLSNYREHVTGFMKSHQDFNPIFLPPRKLSIDTMEDYENLVEFYKLENTVNITKIPTETL